MEITVLKYQAITEITAPHHCKKDNFSLKNIVETNNPPLI